MGVAFSLGCAGATLFFKASDMRCGDRPLGAESGLAGQCDKDFAAAVKAVQKGDERLVAEARACDEEHVSLRVRRPRLELCSGLSRFRATVFDLHEGAVGKDGVGFMPVDVGRELAKVIAEPGADDDLEGGAGDALTFGAREPFEHSVDTFDVLNFFEGECHLGGVRRKVGIGEHGRHVPARDRFAADPRERASGAAGRVQSQCPSHRLGCVGEDVTASAQPARKCAGARELVGGGRGEGANQR